jgi:hypothetical protein
MDGTGSGSCPVVDSGVVGADPSGCLTGELVRSYVLPIS